MTISGSLQTVIAVAARILKAIVQSGRAWITRRRGYRNRATLSSGMFENVAPEVFTHTAKAKIMIAHAILIFNAAVILYDAERWFVLHKCEDDFLQMCSIIRKV